MMSYDACKSVKPCSLSNLKDKVSIHPFSRQHVERTTGLMYNLHVTPEAGTGTEDVLLP